VKKYSIKIQNMKTKEIKEGIIQVKTSIQTIIKTFYDHGWEVVWFSHA
jgi:hypothetical protein